jgi:pimeloyl-ACP methyl ester carboxylesterase
MSWLVAFVGIAVALVVGADGSAHGRVLRVLVVLALTALMFRIVRSERPAPRAWTEFGAGIVGVTIGIGIGARHVVGGDVTVTALVATASLFAGLVLIAWGGINVIRSVAGWRRLPMTLGVVALTLVTIPPVGIALAATNVPRDDMSDATPADDGLEYRDVTLTTADDVTLSGWYVPGRTGAAVALLHGAGSTRQNTLRHAAVLAEHGFGVLLFDARGHGRSGGRAMDFGWYGDADVTAAIDFLADQPGVALDRIGVVGLSMGGEEAIGAAAADPRVRAVVAEGVTGRTAADHAWLADEYGLRGWLQRGVDWITYSATDLFTDSHPPIALREAAAQAATPMLLIAAGTVADEQHAARDIERAAPETVDVWVVDGSSHTGGLETAPAEWKARVTAFLDDALRSVPARLGPSALHMS